MSEYEITSSLAPWKGTQSMGYLTPTHVNKSICRFLSSFLKIAAAVNVLID